MNAGEQKLSYSSSYYRYMQSIEDYNILTTEEQMKLFKELSLNPTSERKDYIVERLLESNLKLVIHFAQRMYIPTSCIDIMDLISAGNKTLLKCIYNYKIDNDKAARFSTYAGHCIKTDMRKEFNQHDLIRIPRDHKIYRSKLLRSMMDEKDIPDMTKSFMDISGKIYFEEVESIDDCGSISKEYDILDGLYVSDIRSILKPKMNCLSKKQRAVIDSFYFSGKEKTMEEIAKEFNTSKQAVSILLKRTLYRLRTLMQPFDFEELI